MNQKVWPKDHSPEEIRNIIAEGDSAKAGGLASWKEAGIAEILLRTKKSNEKSNRIIIWISIAILIISGLGLIISILK